MPLSIAFQGDNTMAPWKISFGGLRVTPNTYKMKNKASVEHWILAVKLK
jgi:hypothetical protein